MYVCIFIKDAQVVVRRHRDNGNRDWSQIRDAAFFVEWYLRISQYPTGPGLFRDVACTVGAGEQFDTFYSAARDLHDLVSNGELSIQCAS